ncbi:MAG: hypothetical protein KU38_13060 [Sulfurovum sp. FS08-3]|nr:MAG: hypothetical protein KU38_13060 [Sulfurovum sp. FS08-3]
MTKNFLELIKEYKIVIPLIQRDYAQGRAEEKSKANNFLTSIYDGIQTGLNLDFVYGKVDEEKKEFLPLDGQQRLTTLLLLHWFISLEGEYLPEINKFSYEVRSSTKDFINKLTQKDIWEKFSKKDVKASIENTNWFFLSWKNDPTVVALLNMLDLIENKFQDVKIEGLDMITFEFLNLNEFNLTDELYVKMNARGKPLTDFENFKSNFEKYLKDEKIKAKLDNEWLDIFWEIAQKKISKEKKDISEAPKLADEMFYNFFYNVTFNFYLENTDKLNCKDKEFNKLEDFVEECSIFDFYKNVYNDTKKINEVISILNHLDADNEIFLAFIERKNISQWERVRFYALSLGYIKILQESAFLEWKRVTFNLINNQLIQSPDDIIKTIKSLKELSENSFDIYDFIKNSPDNILYFTKIQREEESLKAHLILENKAWENEIIDAENNWYLDGQIGFLLEFSNNSLDDFIEYRDKFNALWEFAQNKKDIDKKQLKHQQVSIYQALLSKGDYLPKLGLNNTFCSFDVALRTKIDNWRKVFNSEKKQYLKDLFDDVDFDEKDVEKSLATIVDGYCLSDWRSYFIKNSSYIEYCKMLQIRWHNENNIRLLTKTQINGTHVELYSWDFYNKELKSNKIYESFESIWYSESTSSWPPPYIMFYNFIYKQYKIQLEIEYEENGFRLTIYDGQDNWLPKEIKDEINKSDIKYDDLLEEVQRVCDILKPL